MIDFVTLFSICSAVNVIKSENFVESIEKLIHKCLISLGDVSRYLSEFDDCSLTAEKYYTMAILLDSEIGIPLNQLGTLAGRTNCSCDAAFFYLLCLSTTHPFDGAKDNLQMLFKRNEKRLLELTKQQMKNRNENSKFVDFDVSFSFSFVIFDGLFLVLIVKFAFFLSNFYVLFIIYLTRTTCKRKVIRRNFDDFSLLLLLVVKCKT